MATLSKSERPKIKIPLKPFDYALEILAVLGLATLLFLSAFHYGQLPEQIPTHFGADGRPNAFGPKTTLWVLPVLGFVLFSILTFINRCPERFNFTVGITAENAESQYIMATRLTRAMKAIVMLLFAFLVWRTIGIAQNEADRLGIWLLPIVLVTTLGTVFFYIFRSVARK